MKHLGTITLTTNRLILRQFTSQDAEAMFQNWASDPEVTRYLTWKPLSDVTETAAILSQWIAQYQNDNYYAWAITHKDNPDMPIGSIAAVSSNDDIASVEIGYCLSQSWWHQGIMSESLAAVITFFFEQVGVNRVAAYHDPHNPHSGMVMQKCGMTYEGTLRSADKNNQGICDMCCYSILKSDYNELNTIR